MKTNKTLFQKVKGMFNVQSAEKRPRYEMFGFRLKVNRRTICDGATDKRSGKMMLDYYEGLRKLGHDFTITKRTYGVKSIYYDNVYENETEYAINYRMRHDTMPKLDTLVLFPEGREHLVKVTGGAV